jgi:hypothetical protein
MVMLITSMHLFDAEAGGLILLFEKKMLITDINYSSFLTNLVGVSIQGYC